MKSSVGLVLLMAVGILSMPQGYEYTTPGNTYLVPGTSQQPMKGMPYDFIWNVEDQETGNAFSHIENSDGTTMQGEYRVLLPDGRTQVVSFTDNGSGYQASVTYE